MIDKTVNYLQDIELLKKIEPIAERMGLEKDAWHAYEPDHKKWLVIPIGCEPEFFDHCREKNKTYTSSSLELLLPGWFYKLVLTGIRDWEITKVELFTYCKKDFKDSDAQIFYDYFTKRGKEKVEALARLIILLEENGLLESN